MGLGRQTWQRMKKPLVEGRGGERDENNKNIVILPDVNSLFDWDNYN